MGCDIYGFCFGLVRVSQVNWKLGSQDAWIGVVDILGLGYSVKI